MDPTTEKALRDAYAMIWDMLNGYPVRELNMAPEDWLTKTQDLFRAKGLDVPGEDD